MCAEMGIRQCRITTAFMSNQMPTTAANPCSGTAPKTDGFDAQAPGITGATYDNYGADGGAAAASSTDKSQFTPMSGKEERIEGASERPKGGRLDAALADKDGINSYMEKFSSGDRQRAASSAFLNAEGGLEGLQARDAVNGVVYAGGQHRIESGDGTQVINRSDARQIASGKAKAQDFLNNKKAEVTAAAKQEPTTLQNAASSQAFQQDKQMSSTMPGDIGGKTEYYTNNDNVVEPFGAPKGYKSDIKRIDTSMPNGFAG